MGESGARAVSGSELIGAAAKQLQEVGMGTEKGKVCSNVCVLCFLPLSE